MARTIGNKDKPWDLWLQPIFRDDHLRREAQSWSHGYSSMIQHETCFKGNISSSQVCTKWYPCSLPYTAHFLMSHIQQALTNIAMNQSWKVSVQQLCNLKFRHYVFQVSSICGVGRAIFSKHCSSTGSINKLRWYIPLNHMKSPVFPDKLHGITIKYNQIIINSH